MCNQNIFDIGDTTFYNIVGITRKIKKKIEIGRKRKQKKDLIRHLLRREVQMTYHMDAALEHPER